jgi:hypothetical protein
VVSLEALLLACAANAAMPMHAARKMRFMCFDFCVSE